jgi:cytochrome c-type biogenesis protein CcmE
MKRKSNKRPFLLALLLFLGGVGYLIYGGLSENTVYFLNVSEALALEQKQLDSARLFGTVDAQELTKAENGAGVTFRLLDKDDKGQSIMVAYAGAVPDTFKPGVEVIVEGGWNQESGQFKAATLMTKCPSKYKSRSEG